MNELLYTLAPDGPTDRALLPILTWLLEQSGVKCAIQSKIIEPLPIPKQPDAPRLSPLAWRIKYSLEYFPCDLLFVHRDAEKESPDKRNTEIEEACRELTEIQTLPVICVVPVRMTEAWLLIEKQAIRYAAGNKNGRNSLAMPTLRSLENLSDPKETLYQLIQEACGLSGRRRRQIPVSLWASRVVDYIEDFSPLRQLTAFRTLEEAVNNLVRTQAWDELT